MSESKELALQLMRINKRIRFVRWISMSQNLAKKSKGAPQPIMDALVNKEAERGSAVTHDHIARPMNQITDAGRRALSDIYFDGTDAVSGRILQETEQ